MIKIEIKNRFTGSIIFEYSKENNTIKETLLQAIKDGADLRGANLRSANLESANLESANLESANLRGANLESANLESANLESANLRSANLESANLRGANLRGANLRGANLESANLESANLESANLESANLESANLRGANLPIFCKWSISFVLPNKIRIGCKAKSVEEWEHFFYKTTDEYSTKRGTKDFNLIQGCFEAYKNFLVFYMK